MTIFYSFLGRTAWASRHWSKLLDVNAYSISLLLQDYRITYVPHEYKKRYNPILRTHKLKGKLSGAWAYTVEYNCRIVFSFGENKETKEEEIILIDIGTHDEVY